MNDTVALIIEKILDYVELEEEITEGSSLRNDCGLTSFDTVCLFDDLCKEFGKDIDQVAVRSCETVGDLVELFAK